MFIAATIEVVLNYRKERKDNTESQGEQVDVESQPEQGDAKTQVRKQPEEHSETVTAT